MTTRILGLAAAVTALFLVIAAPVARAQAQAWNSVRLNWTAPGDDSLSGTASQYDIRYSTSPINANNYANATQVTGEPAPAAPGTAQNFTVTGLSPSTTYYFALKTADEVPNWSLVSNIVSATTAAAPDVTAPAAVRNLGVGFVGFGWVTAGAAPRTREVRP